MKTLARFVANESGATAIEYGLIAAHRCRDHQRSHGGRYRPLDNVHDSLW